MKNLLIVLIIILSVISCKDFEKKDEITSINWEKRKTTNSNFSDLIIGKTYLPIYSHIYHRFEHRTFNLTTTVSIRNVSINDTLYLKRADYYNTNGAKIREYLSFPVYLAPLETVEIVIEEDDIEGGSGANFIFNWAIADEKNLPLFEAIMISTSGQQGLSFSTRGVRID